MNDGSQRERLRSIKLEALVKHRTGGAEAAASGGFGAGAALLVGDVAWVLLDPLPEKGIGAALAWAIRQGASELHVLAERSTGLLARRAEAFGLPTSVWHVDGRDLLPAIAEPLSEAPQLPETHRQWIDAIVDAGALPVIEHGVLAGEVNGLEVCRVVDDQRTGEVRLEVGVGAHDRETFQLLHGDRPTREALADVVGSVAVHRARGAARHPLNLLAQERALRARLIVEPSLVEASSVTAAEPPVARTNVKDAVPCVALAAIAGSDVTVVCSSGVDLEVVPFAVDARAMLGTDDCIVVLPSRDALDIQHRLAALARPSVRIAAVD